jgi:choline dehydrogenase
VAKLPGVERPKDGNAGTHGLFWIPASIHPVTYERSYARNGHFDNITRPNYELLPEHKVTRVTFDIFDGITANGVEMMSTKGNSTKIIVKANKEVILAAGAIHTPHILMLSGIGPLKVLERARITVRMPLSGVGQKFQDQGWIGNVAFKCKSSPNLPPKQLTTNAIQGTNGTGPPVPKVNVTRVPGQPPQFNVVARLALPIVSNKTASIAAAYQSQDPAAHLPADASEAVVAGYAAFQKLHARQLARPGVSWMGFLVNPGPGGNVMHLHTLSHGVVTLDPADAGAEPVVDYRALSNPADMALAIEYVRWLRRFVALPDFAPWAPEEISPGAHVQSDEELAAWVRKVYNPSLYHPVGTAAKMPAALGGVVGEDLLVHRMRRLSVVDASIMPTMPGGPTSQTVYMIAEKVSERSCEG